MFCLEPYSGFWIILESLTSFLVASEQFQIRNEASVRMVSLKRLIFEYLFIYSNAEFLDMSKRDCENGVKISL